MTALVPGIKKPPACAGLLAQRAPCWEASRNPVTVTVHLLGNPEPARAGNFDKEKANQHETVTRLRAALHVLRGPRARLRHAEQRFFDAYSRGGALQDRRLVVPLDFFSRPTVQRALYNWLGEGQVLDLDALEAEWDSTHRELDKDAFRENITQFLALLANPGACRVTWTLPDGTPFDYGSEVLR